MSVFDALKGRSVLLTGHTGFKGAWLGLWLSKLGAEVHGFSLPPATTPNLYNLLGSDIYKTSSFGDVRDAAAVQNAYDTAQPDIVFHLAAQAIVRRSYRDPLETFATNVMGTANVLEASRERAKSPAIVCVTTDKVYENHDWPFPYRETDTLGGKDPYSASKAAAELVAASYQRAVFQLEDVPPRLVTVRGGNVVGGGDWSEDRIIPDAIRAAQAGKPLQLRSPQAVRPWQHVLELCHAYITMAEGMIGAEALKFTGAWNFGPSSDVVLSVEQVAKILQKELSSSNLEIEIAAKPDLPEANYLTLDTSKAARQIRWKPVLSAERAITLAGEWYEDVNSGKPARDITERQMDAYIHLRSSL